MDDRWDVVVVGLRDPSHAAAMMAVAELAHYASLPPQDVERMLEDGEVPVLENLDRAEAERAAYELAELGAQVDLRLAMTDSGVFPVFKPDAERQIGVAVGGLIDDSATPPAIGAAVGLPRLELDTERPQEPRTRPPSTRPPEGRSAGPSTEEHGAGRARTTTPAAGDQFGPRDRKTTPASDDSGSGPRARKGPPASDDSGSGPRARKGTPAPGKGTRPGASGRSKPDMESFLSDIGSGSGSAAAEAPKLPQRLQQAAAAAEGARAELEVDFAAAGIAAPPKRGRMGTPAPTHVADRSSSHMPRHTRAGHMGGTGASAAGRSHHGSGMFEVLRDDRISKVLMGLCVGLALSLLLALQLQRTNVRDSLPPLEEELATALADPIGVAEGKRRAPVKVEEELDDALDGMQRSFLVWWLVPGLVVGLLLSRIRAG